MILPPPVQYLHPDHLGSPVAATDVFGDVVGTQSFYPFGEVRASTGVFDTERGFTGQIADAGTGLNFYNARYYDTALGKFISPDSIVPNPQNPGLFNRFAYVSNNPLKYTDPTGHSCEGDSKDDPNVCGTRREKQFGHATNNPTVGGGMVQNPKINESGTSISNLTDAIAEDVSDAATALLEGVDELMRAIGENEIRNANGYMAILDFLNETQIFSVCSGASGGAGGGAGSITCVNFDRDGNVSITQTLLVGAVGDGTLAVGADAGIQFSFSNAPDLESLDGLGILIGGSVNTGLGPSVVTGDISISESGTTTFSIGGGVGSTGGAVFNTWTTTIWSSKNP